MAIVLRTKGENGAGGSGTTVALPLTGIVAGDLIVAFAGNSTSGSVMSISDGTSSLTGLTAQTIGTSSIRGFYLLASVASGSVTYTLTCAPAAVSKELHVWVFNPNGSATFDTERHDGQNAASSAVSSGSITTAGTDEVVVAALYEPSTSAVSSMQINSVAADSTQAPGGNMSSWERILTGTMTGAATATLAGAVTWLCSVAALQVAAGGANVTRTPDIGALVLTGQSPSSVQSMANTARIVIRQA